MEGRVKSKGNCKECGKYYESMFEGREYCSVKCFLKSLEFKKDEEDTKS